MTKLQVYIESDDPEIMDNIKWIHNLNLIDNLEATGELLVFLGVMFQKKAAVLKYSTTRRHRKSPIDKLL